MFFLNLDRHLKKQMVDQKCRVFCWRNIAAHPYTNLTWKQGNADKGYSSYLSTIDPMIWIKNWLEKVKTIVENVVFTGAYAPDKIEVISLDPTINFIFSIPQRATSLQEMKNTINLNFISQKAMSWDKGKTEITWRQLSSSHQPRPVSQPQVC